MILFIYVKYPVGKRLYYIGNEIQNNLSGCMSVMADLPLFMLFEKNEEASLFQLVSACWYIHFCYCLETSCVDSSGGNS